MTTTTLTHQRLLEVLHYEPTTGAFTWRVRKAKHTRIGEPAGRIKKDCGYVFISVDNKDWRAHRLAWFYVHGRWPQYDCDHIDGVRHNNAIANLRDVTRTVNLQNRRHPRKDSSTGLLGVAKAVGNRFRSQISVNGSLVHLGTFDTPDKAHAAYIAAKRQLHEGNTL